MIVRNGQPLIHALDRYKTGHGTYPATLDDLVPKYIRAIPGTGLVQGRRFLYIREGDNPASDESFAHVTGSALRLSGNQYVLVVLMIPAGTLVYRPNGEYSDLPGYDADGWRWTGLD